MVNSTADKTAAPGFIFLLLVLLSTGVAFISQARDTTKYEGVYPVIKNSVKGVFDFREDHVTITIAGNQICERIAVFAYDEHGYQLGILKPIYNNTIIITQDDFPDYRVSFKKGMVKDYKLLRNNNRAEKRETFLSILTAARENDHNFGIQECLYPLCTRCMDVCMVKTYNVIEMHIAADGVIFPVFYNEGCPRCGKCINACKQRVICNSRDLPLTVDPESVNDKVEIGPIDFEKLKDFAL